ncbi:MAG: hypothetical protein ACW99F_05870 [Candidatus Hodarchaeales archaeon]|jgi:hypothetical protein
MNNEKSNETSESFETMMKGCMESMGDFMKNMEKMSPQKEAFFSSFSKTDGKSISDLCQSMCGQGTSCCQPESE